MTLIAQEVSKEGLDWRKHASDVLPALDLSQRIRLQKGCNNALEDITGASFALGCDFAITTWPCLDRPLLLHHALWSG